MSHSPTNGKPDAYSPQRIPADASRLPDDEGAILTQDDQPILTEKDQPLLVQDDGTEP